MVGWRCAPNPKTVKPILKCTTDNDCVEECKKHKYPDACAKMTTCDETKFSAICNDLQECQQVGEYGNNCETIGGYMNGPVASLVCEERKGHDGKRCYNTGRTFHID